MYGCSLVLITCSILSTHSKEQGSLIKLNSVRQVTLIISGLIWF